MSGQQSSPDIQYRLITGGGRSQGRGDHFETANAEAQSANAAVYSAGRRLHATAAIPPVTGIVSSHATSMSRKIIQRT